MTETDLSTGLPALPEGMYWRVSESRTFYYEPAVCVAIVTDKVGEATERVRNMWGRNKYISVDKPYTETVYSEAVRCEDSYDLLDIADITDEDISRTADLVYAGYLKNLGKEAKRKRYLGDYPPKSLN